MIKKLVFVWDFLYHEVPDNPFGVYHWYLVDIFNVLVEMTTGLKIVQLKDMQNSIGETFSRKHFYELSNYNDITDSYFSYDVSKIKQESIDYLNSFIDSETFVFGCELGLDLRQILTDLNIKFVNFWYHSWKLFDDTFLMINTNDEQIFEKLNKYKVQKEKFLFYAKYWKHFVYTKNELKYLDYLEDNSCLFVGQTYSDKSTDKEGVMLNILHFKNEMEELSKQYSKIYYTPHPYKPWNDEVEEYIATTPYIQKLDTVPTYHLLMRDEIKKVVGISSSVLYEAQFFEKDVTYLYQPLFKIDEEFSLNTFISIFDDYYNPYFWADVLSCIMPTNMNVQNENWFVSPENKLRNILHLYYGYQNFNENYRFAGWVRNDMRHLISLLKNKRKIRLKYYKYRLLSNFVFGKTKERYKRKKEFYKNQHKAIKNL